MHIDPQTRRSIRSLPAAHLFASAPIAFTLTACVPPLYLVGHALGFEPNVLVPFMAFIVCAIPLVLLCGALRRAGYVASPTRWVLSAGTLVVAAGLIAWFVPTGPARQNPGPVLAIIMSAALITPTLTAYSGQAGELQIWRRVTRVVLRSCIGFGFLCWFSFIFAATGFILLDDLSFVDFGPLAFVTGACFLTSALLAPGDRDQERVEPVFDATEKSLTRWTIWASLSAAVVGSLLVVEDTATYTSPTMYRGDAWLRAMLLASTSFAAATSTFLTRNLPSGAGMEGPGLDFARVALRVFSIGLVAVIVWSCPPMLESLALDGWPTYELFPVVLIATCTAYCILKLAFDVLDRHLPIWAPTTMGVVGALVFGGLAI